MYRATEKESDIDLIIRNLYLVLICANPRETKRGIEFSCFVNYLRLSHNSLTINCYNLQKLLQHQRVGEFLKAGSRFL